MISRQGTTPLIESIALGIAAFTSGAALGQAPEPVQIAANLRVGVGA